MTQQGYTHICLVTDRSGSMQGIAADMNGAIVQMMKEQSEVPGKVLVDVIIFDGDIEVLHENVKPEDVSHTVIRPGGSTALNDAVGFSINRLGNKLKVMQEDQRPEHVIVVVVTDGGENASREFALEQVKQMVKEQTEKWGWTFLYLAANVDAFATGDGYGFAKGSTIGYVATAGGGQNAYAAASASIIRTRSGLSAEFTDEEREAANTA